MSEYNPLQKKTGVQSARALCQQAAQLHEQGDYCAARTRYERALAIQESLLGQEHLDTARSMHGLAQVVMKQGEDALAKKLLEQALALQEKALGPEHADTAASLHTLGELSSNQGDLETGSQLMARAYLFRELALGRDHADTLESLTLLALMLARQGELAKARHFLEDALSRCEAALGEVHRTTARVLNGLGRLYAADEATYARAHALYERALSTDERLLGPDHPQTALVVNNLAALLRDMHDYAAALPLLERSLAAHEQVYGVADWRTSFVLVNLADVHNKRGEHAAARPLLERALIIRQRVWGARHPETIVCLRELVATLGHLQEQGDEGAMLASMPLVPILTSLEMGEGEFGPAERAIPGAHLDPARAAEHLGCQVSRIEAELARPPLSAAEQTELEAAAELVRQADEYYRQGDYALAALRLDDALRAQERVLGDQHIDHIALLRRLVDTRERQGLDSTVLPLTQKIVDIHVEVLGPDHPATLHALSELVSRHADEYGFAATRSLRERIWRSMEETLGADDPIVQLTRRSFDGM
jgi:tetratricopeptide (TPR) repeat protein